MKDNQQNQDKELEASNKRAREYDEGEKILVMHSKVPNLYSKLRTKSWIELYSRFKS